MLLGIVFRSAVLAQISDEYRLKAAFLYNFTKFVEWPPDVFSSPDDPITICVLGNNPFGSALAEAIHQKKVQERTLEFKSVSDPERICECKVLFVNSADRKRFQSVLGSISAHGILTVGENESFARDGGVINLKREGDKVRIQINAAAAKRQDIRISSRLMSLAEIVEGSK